MSENWMSSLAQAPEDANQAGDHRKIPPQQWVPSMSSFFLGGTERPGKWKLDSAGERQDSIILGKFLSACRSAELDKLASAAVKQREEVNAAKALSQAEQKNYCFPGVMGIAGTARQEAELWIPALGPVLGKARQGRAVEPLEGLLFTSTSRSQL